VSVLAGRTALVTGASRGVGRAIALRLAACGAGVAVNFRRDATAAADVVGRIRAAGGQAEAYAASIEDVDAVRRMVDQVHEDLGPVDIVVSNAGMASRGETVGRTSLAQFESLMAVHALGPIALLQLLLPDLRAAARADVIAISSDSVLTAPACAAPYTMAKAALEMCIRTLAREERSSGIRANIVAPGLVATDMGDRLVRSTGANSVDDLAQASPFGRICQPEDVAAAVAFLVSPDSSYITGQRLAVDGGGRDPVLF
jgi:NAD(P)-dependent dehydrogenase (short-subunit alcohol dehydrogenase family)